MRLYAFLPSAPSETPLGSGYERKFAGGLNSAVGDTNLAESDAETTVLIASARRSSSSEE